MSAYRFWSHAGHPKAVEEPARSRSRSPEQWSKVPEDDAEPMVAETQKENTSDKQRSNLGIALFNSQSFYKDPSLHTASKHAACLYQ